MNKELVGISNRYESSIVKNNFHVQYVCMMKNTNLSAVVVYQVESELIDKLDILISENKGDDEYRQLFNTM